MPIILLKIIALISVLLIAYGSKNNKNSVKYTGYGAAAFVAIVFILNSFIAS